MNEVHEKITDYIYFVMKIQSISAVEHVKSKNSSFVKLLSHFVHFVKYHRKSPDIEYIF